MAQFLDLEGLTTFLAKVKEWVTSQINTAKSALQSAINNKADKSHTHSNLTITLNGGTTEGTDKIVYTGGAAKTLNITASEVGAASSSHTHPISQISDLNASWDTYLKTAPKLINGATSLTNQDLNSYSSTSNCGWYFAGGGNTVTNKPSGVASFGLEIVRTASGVVTQVLYGQVGEDNELKVYYRRYYESWTSWKKIADSDDLAGKANTSHTHTISQVTNLQSTLDGKAASSHTHPVSQISDLNSSWDALLKAAPSAYVTRHPTISEVTGKQDLNLKFSGESSTVYNGTAEKTVIFPGFHSFSFNNNTYCKLFTITITNQYTNTPLLFRILGRSGGDCLVKLQFNNAASADAHTISKFTYVGTYTAYASKLKVYKTGTAKWEVWLTSQTQSHDSGYVYNLVVPGSVTLVWSGSNTDTGPTVTGTACTLDSEGIQGVAKATSSLLGGIKIGYTESGKNYPVELDSSGKAFVNVPWTDNNTTYSNATSSTAGLMSAADKTKLDGIATGANKYVHPTTSGNKHIPAGGSSGQILRWASDGTAQWGSDNNTTYSVFKAATASAAGGSGLVPAPAAGKNDEYLRGDGTWAVPTNTTYSVFKGATSSAAGSSGLVPQPAAGSQTKYLRADGTWQTPTNTTYGLASTTANGLLKQLSGSTSQFMRGDGNWATPPNTTYSNATTSTDGLMSSEDKSKLNGIASGANKYTHPSYTSRTSGLYKITVDSTGHVSAATAVAKSDIVALGIPGSDTNTHYTTHLYAGTSTGSANATTSNGSTHLIITDDSTVRNRIKITGSGATTVSSDDEGNITIKSTDTNTTYSLSGLGGIGTVNGSGSGGLNLSASKSGTTATVSGSLKLRNSTAASNSSTYTAGGSSKFYSLQIDKDGYLGTYVPWTDNNTTYSIATASKAGLVKPVSVITKPTINTASTTSGKYYHVQMSSDGNMFVNVPWTDTKTTTIAWSSITGKPSTFTPSSHSHTCSQITDLDAISITDIEALF